MELSNEDITFITEETLEFCLLVPLDGQEEEDSAISTVEPGERCMAQAIDMNILLGESESKGREQPSQWSPLSPEKLEEVRKEANMLAEQLERCRLLEKENGSHETRLPVVPELAQLPPTGFLHGGRPSPRNPRRKTFNVNNSPLKALLPTVGPETSLACVSPKARFPKGRSPSSCIVDLPSPKRLQSKSQVFNADSQLAKKAGPSRLFKASTATKSGTKKPQAPNRNSKQETTPRVTIPSATHAQESLQRLKPFPQITNRRPLGKTKGASTSNLSAENAQDPSNKGRKLVTHVEAKPRLRLCAPHPSPVKKCLAFPKKVVSPHKAEQRRAHRPTEKPPMDYMACRSKEISKAGGFKAMGSDASPLQAFSKPCGTTNQIQTRCMATSALASQLPVPRATGRGVTSGRQAVPGRPSQLKPLSFGMPGRQGSAVPTGKKASTFQQTVPCGRLRLPKKTVSVNSK